MASVNKVIIIGNLGRDPEVRYLASGTAVCTLAVATTRGWKDKTSGEKKEETEWHQVSLFDRLAEVAGEYLKKGKPVYIEGRLKTEKWQDKDGNDRYSTKIYADSLQLLGGREDGAGDGGQQRQAAPAPAPRQAAAPRPAPAPKTSPGFDDMDDDIPF